MRLQGKTILVTAAGQGIGRASALACLKEGANVIATDVNESLFSGLDGMETAALDVRDPEAIKILASRVGPLDGLFNCAGFVHHGTLLDVTDDDWAFSFDLNVTAMMRLARACLPGMLERAAETGSASILNMASMASSIKGFVNRTAYGASKAAVIGLTKAVAADFVKHGIRCNALCPGTVDTPSLRGRIASAADPIQAEKDFIARQPMGRLATVDDITPMVVFLLSDESRFVTGQAVLVDGGVTI
ncbi:SDR family oxidoreductase [Sinorhizobium alkalisoli]|uniref:NAD(P)-dependent oxidoreductase n=1 Tax=Sinorhizobium alkalisoli TaxID=1752398 RepID=A0A1E3VC62_9HYPH|nr:SDR family oxidoreductase [Sinorhizobium alkalisoli]MCA1494152.1 SDR family oxidoreductase [Ensifer sp. NBAIM29]MCG5479120.1 SDR family oxidoreductase [Sinorhizobium alkalisoli]ODR91170.1 NAD(P)-dependent oxidoreductase [Sinorhizobium alkalisoli]QFI66770.1 2-keto-3-deoxy-L-fuconate dehydrogenase [Sinorhizobium alkalisoli]